MVRLVFNVTVGLLLLCALLPHCSYAACSSSSAPTCYSISEYLCGPSYYYSASCCECPGSRPYCRTGTSTGPYACFSTPGISTKPSARPTFRPTARPSIVYKKKKGNSLVGAIVAPIFFGIALIAGMAYRYYRQQANQVSPTMLPPQLHHQQQHPYPSHQQGYPPNSNTQHPVQGYAAVPVHSAPQQMSVVYPTQLQYPSSGGVGGVPQHMPMTSTSSYPSGAYPSTYNNHASGIQMNPYPGAVHPSPQAVAVFPSPVQNGYANSQPLPM